MIFSLCLLEQGKKNPKILPLLSALSTQNVVDVKNAFDVLHIVSINNVFIGLRQLKVKESIFDFLHQLELYLQFIETFMFRLNKLTLICFYFRLI